MNKLDISEKLEQWHLKNGMPGNLKLHFTCPENVHIKKEKIPFYCETCKAGVNGHWEMLYHNVINGKGCPCCRRNKEVFDLFYTNSFFYEKFDLIIINNQSGIPDTKLIRYKLKDKKNGHTSKGDGHARNYLLRCFKENIIPGGDQFSKYDKIKKIGLKFKEIFPNSTIDFKCDKKEGCASPGPFFSINILDSVVGKNLKIDFISIKGIRRIIEQEINYKASVKKWEILAKDNGAQILNYSYYTTNKVLISYISRTKWKCRHTIYRAKETNWGQSGFYKGEKLCRVILEELFPSVKDDWLWNNRPNFLKYNEYNLELDGYNEKLKLAFEHQGAHHYEQRDGFSDPKNSLEEIKKRDNFKLERCAAEGIILLTINQTNKNTDPDAYTSDICTQLDSLNIEFNPKYSMENIISRWNEVCENPLKDFQEKILKKLNRHTLIDLDFDQVTPSIDIKYKCFNCGGINISKAKSIADGEILKYCLNCKGAESAIKKALKRIEKIKCETEEYIHQFLHYKVNKGIVLQCKSNPNHFIRVSTIKNNNYETYFENGLFFCKECELVKNNKEATVENKNRISNLNHHKNDFYKSLESIGFYEENIKKIDFHADVGSIFANLICPKGHEFILSMKEVADIKKNTYLNEKKIVPYVCLECCYAGSNSKSKRNTVFHRLDFLKKFHINCSYIGNFDKNGNSMEEYNCGNKFNISGLNHPNFFIRGKTIGSTDKANKFKTPCYVCGVINGDISSAEKTLDMITGRMRLINEKLHELYPNKIGIAEPIVKLNDESSVPISTTRTRLFFHCGNDDHQPKIDSLDSYFNVNRTGYCKECLALVGLNNLKNFRF